MTGQTFQKALSTPTGNGTDLLGQFGGQGFSGGHFPSGLGGTRTKMFSEMENSSLNLSKTQWART